MVHWKCGGDTLVARVIPTRGRAGGEREDVAGVGGGRGDVRCARSMTDETSRDRWCADMREGRTRG